MTQRVACRDAGMKSCDFAVESNEKEELVDMAKRHVRDKHDREISRQDVLDASKRVKKARSGSSEEEGPSKRERKAQH